MMNAKTDAAAGGEIHTVIFDMDGTLADSAVLTVKAFERVLPRFGLPMPSMDEVKKAVGYANPEFYYRLFPGFPTETVAAAGQEVEREELRIIPAVSGRLLFPGCHELLLYLKAKNISLCIASTGSHEHVCGVLGAAGVLGLFDKISCGRPDKTEMLRELTPRGSKEGFVMVGDMKKDYEAARANGILSVGACYGYCRRENGGFDIYIETPWELAGVLGI